MQEDFELHIRFKKFTIEAMLYRIKAQRQFGRNFINLLSFLVLATSIMLIIYTNAIDKTATDFVSALNIILSIAIIMIGYESYGEGNDGRIVSAKLFLEFCEKIEASELPISEKYRKIVDHFDHLKLEHFRTDTQYVCATNQEFVSLNKIVLNTKLAVFRYKYYKWINFFKLLFIPAFMCLIIMLIFINLDNRMKNRMLTPTSPPASSLFQ